MTKRPRTAKPGRAKKGRAKTARKASKGAVKPKKKIKKGRAKVTRGGAPKTNITFAREIAPRPVARPVGKRAAVIGCVNSTMDVNQAGWNSDGHGNGRKMGDYFGYNTHSMQAFLGAVTHCLQPTYALAVDKMSMDDCVAATVGGLKILVLENTT
jgi:hypothetical protein